MHSSVYFLAVINIRQIQYALDSSQSYDAGALVAPLFAGSGCSVCHAATVAMQPGSPLQRSGNAVVIASKTSAMYCAPEMP